MDTITKNKMLLSSVVSEALDDYNARRLKRNGSLMVRTSPGWRAYIKKMHEAVLKRSDPYKILGYESFDADAEYLKKHIKVGELMGLCDGRVVKENGTHVLHVSSGSRTADKIDEIANGYDQVKLLINAAALEYFTTTEHLVF